MAVRPVFEAIQNRHQINADCHMLCLRKDTAFAFFSGFSDQQKKRSIRSLHQAFLEGNPNRKVLEISSRSEEVLGVSLSAFHLMLHTAEGKEYTVESAFQAGQVFENGGPYRDLLEASPRAAKKDERLRTSGGIVAFEYNGERFATEPKTLFYNWIYMNALAQSKALAAQILEYDAFTDIEFNPQKSINCQAEAAAVYVSLQRLGLLEEALQSKEKFREIVYISKMD